MPEENNANVFAVSSLLVSREKVREIYTNPFGGTMLVKSEFVPMM